jgi:hypothetical protein
MKKLIFVLGVFAFVSCSKKDAPQSVVTPPSIANPNTPTTPTTPVVDYSTKYTTSQNVVFKRTLLFDGIHPETLKIINTNDTSKISMRKLKEWTENNYPSEVQNVLKYIEKHLD